MRDRVARLVCWLHRHRPVRVIDACEPVPGGIGGLHFRITAEHRECGRCGVALNTAAPPPPRKAKGWYTRREVG